jgi:hypothetical protein
MTVLVLAGPVVPHRCARVGVTGGDLADWPTDKSMF